MTMDPEQAKRRGRGADPDDPALRLFRGPDATSPDAWGSDEPPPEVRTVIVQHAVPAVVLPIAAVGFAWLTSRGDRALPIEWAIGLAIVIAVVGVASGVTAVLLRMGSERVRRMLTWPERESASDVFVMGGAYMFSRDRLRTRRARQWFARRTEQRRARRTGGPR
ncbi:hypothetical protein [Agrococcus jejuensis]|uniref:Uncharacterized protein n=1 Tax=Agrococcus jejuensis TaxID=399736 RepID=A0A1G7ZZ11_9MICO|nr:hypothetical protein [Agrococcus jejuensis]SDH13440.1 hypothetical protein SAMN04489720_0160 [Agrococcus jejuensis]